MRAFGTSRTVLTRSALRAVRYTSPRIPAATGHHGFVTDLLDPAKYTAVCTCGPEIMMEKVAKMCLRAGVRVYVSREAKMACGVGACLGCTCKSKNGGVSVCKDGPVFEGSVLYELD